MAENLHPAVAPAAPHDAENSYYKIYIDPEVNCIFVKHVNTLTLEHIFERYEDIFANPQMRPHLNYFIDYSESDNQVSPEDIRKLANYLKANKEVRGTCKHAVLCSTGVGYGYSRMLDSLYNAGQETCQNEVQTMIFNAEDYDTNDVPIQEAMNWLEINPEYKIPF